MLYILLAVLIGLNFRIKDEEKAAESGEKKRSKGKDLKPLRIKE